MIGSPVDLIRSNDRHCGHRVSTDKDRNAARLVCGSPKIKKIEFIQFQCTEIHQKKKHSHHHRI